MIRRLVVLLVAASVGAGACTTAADVEIVVAAASSFAPALADVADAYEAEHPGVDITVTIGASSLLRDQVVDARVPVDLLIVADARLLGPVDDEGLAVGDPLEIATNELVLAIPAEDPGRVTGIEDLADPARAIGLCAVGVPCGDLAAAALAAAGIAASVDTYEPNVGSLVAKLRAGELDAGLVYATDVVVSAGALRSIPVLPSLPTTTYGAAVTVTGSASDAASDVLAFLGSEPARAILDRYGFGRP